MNLKDTLIFIVLISFLSCTSLEEKTTQEFIGHVKSLNVDQIKNMSTEDTKFYLKMGIEPIINLGNEESKKQLEQMALTIGCSREANILKCFYLDQNEQKQYFEVELVTGYSEAGEKKLFVDIDKKYFFGE
jgi:hypothetical protein